MIKNLKECMDSKSKYMVTFQLKTGREFQTGCITKADIQILENIVKVAEDKTVQSFFSVDDVLYIKTEKIGK